LPPLFYFRGMNRYTFCLSNCRAILNCSPAFRVPSMAYAAAVPDQLVAKRNPAILGQIFIKSCSIFLGSSFCVSSSRFEDAGRVYPPPRRLRFRRRSPRRRWKFARSSRNREHFFHRARNVSAKSFEDGFARTDYRFRFVAEKPVGRISCSSSLGFAWANASGVGYFLKRVAVT